MSATGKSIETEVYWLPRSGGQRVRKTWGKMGRDC